MSVLANAGSPGQGGQGNGEKEAARAVAAAEKEKEIIFDRKYTCPVCGEAFTSKAVKSSRARLVGTDPDLRAKYDIIDPGKYDVILCHKCGYAALGRFFDKTSQLQVKMLKEKDNAGVQIPKHDGPIYTYPEALERYKLALANAVVKKAKASEKAYICLKSGWVARGYRESLQESGTGTPQLIAELEKREDELLQNAYKGFIEARQSEDYPMCGMDEPTVDYLLATLSVRFQKYDVASKLVASILGNRTISPRMKDKTLDLKDQILKEMKKG